MGTRNIPPVLWGFYGLIKTIKVEVLDANPSFLPLGLHGRDGDFLNGSKEAKGTNKDSFYLYL